MSVSYVADASTWVDLAVRLEAALDAPDKYGCADRNDVLRKVAEARGVNVNSLRKSLDAKAFLEDQGQSQEVYLDAPPSLPKVLVVRAIFNLNRDRGREILQNDPHLQHTEKGLRDELRRLRSQFGGKLPRGIAQAQARQNALQFTSEVFSCLVSNSDKLGISDLLEVNADVQVRPRPDLIARTRYGQTLVVEIKHAPLAVFPKDIYALLGHFSLWERQGCVSWLITSPTWRTGVEEICSLVEEHKIDRFSAAIFDVDGNGDGGLEWVYSDPRFG